MKYHNYLNTTFDNIRNLIPGICHDSNSTQAWVLILFSIRVWLKSTSNLCSLFTRLANRCTVFIVWQGLCTIYEETVIHLSSMLGATFINRRVQRGMYTIRGKASCTLQTKLAKACLIPLSLVIVRWGSYTILGKNNPTLIRLAKSCLCISTHCDAVHICSKICSTLTLLAKTCLHVFTQCDSVHI